MSEPRKNAKKNPESTSVDWAEKLKASMSAGYREEKTDTKSHEEDDLAALLRAQLGKSAEQPSLLDSLDTSDFEEEPEEPTEEEFEDPAEEEFEEIIEDEIEEPAEEEFEDIAEEEFEDIAEEEFEDTAEEEFEDTVEEEFKETVEEEFEDPAEEEFEDTVEEEFEDTVEEEFEETVEEEFEETVEEEFEETVEEEFDETVEEEFEDTVEDEIEEAVEEEFEDTDEDYLEEIPDHESVLYAKEDTETLFDQPWVEYGTDIFDADPYEIIEDDEDDFEDFEADPYDEPELVEEEQEKISKLEPSLSNGSLTSTYRRPTGKGMSDACLNGLAPNEAVGGHRLQALDEENTRLLEEATRFMNSREDPSEAGLDSHDSGERSRSYTDPAESQTDTSGKAGRSYTVQTHDPLQLGLDDVSPTFKKKRYTQPQNSKNDAGDGKSEKEPFTYADEMRANGDDSNGIRDMDLCMRLGYEDSLRRAEDQSVVEEIRTKNYESHTLDASDDRPIPEHGREYRGRVDTDHVESAYIRAYRKNLTLICIACLGALVSVVYDFLPLLLSTASGSSTPFTVSLAYPMIGTIWIALISLPFLRKMAGGIRSLWNFEPTGYAASSVACLVALANGVIACAVAPERQLPLFGAPALFMLTIAAVSEFWITEGEHKAFSVVSSGKPAHVLTGEITSASSEWQNSNQTNKAIDRNPSAGKKRPVMTVVRTNRIADYFSRTEQYNPYMGRLNYMFPVALLIAIVNAGIAVALGSDLVSVGIPVFIATYLATLPAAYLLALTIPLYRVNRILNQKGAAVIGSAAPSEYAGKPLPSLIFSDGDALKSMYRKDITLRDDPDAEEYRRKADMVFRLLDTPLGVEPSLRNRGTDGYRIEIAETGEQYVRLYLTESPSQATTEIMMGSHDALARRGIRLPKINMESRYKKSENSHVIYIAFNRCFHLAYAAEYRVGRTFAKVSSALTDLGHEVALSSYDPMVSEDMEGITLLRKRNRVKLIRPAVYEPIYNTRSGGLIATGRSLDILRPLVACHNMKRAYRRGLVLTWALLALGSVLTVLTVCAGGEALLISAAVFAWQIFSALAVAVATVLSVSRKALSQANEKPGRPNADTSAPASESDGALVNGRK